MQKVWFFATLSASLLTAGLCAALFWEYAVWRRDRRRESAMGSLDHFMATSRFYGPMMIALGGFLALWLLEGLSNGFTDWQAVRASWGSLLSILLFGLSAVVGGVLSVRRGRHLRQSGAPVSDEREEAIDLQANRLVVLVLIGYALIRAGIDYVLAKQAELVLSPIGFAVMNPWIQTLFIILAVMGLAHSYFRWRMS